MGYHRVEKGEWMGSIAARFGNRSWQEIWTRDENKQLRSERPDPELLFAGDRVWIPEVNSKEESAPTDQKHVYTTRRDRAKLTIRLVGIDPYLQAFGSLPYTLEAVGNTQSGEITEDGQLLEMPVDIAVNSGMLWLGLSPVRLSIGGLDPIETVSGIQARLRNLGIDPRPVDNIAGPLTARGVKEFQRRYEITVDGIIGPQTRGKMKEVYGC
jgi:hypothetical protein